MYMSAFFFSAPPRSAVIVMWAGANKPATVPIRALRLAVFIDLLAVSLVVPLLPQRYKDLGVAPALVGIVSSVYSASQIVGGIIFGLLSDRTLGRRTVLLVSMGGAALSYAIIGLATSLPLLIFSRVLVGLVKQTMTISSAIISTWTSKAERTDALGQLSSVAMLAFLLGQSLGGALSTRIHPSAPAALAVALYAVCLLYTSPSPRDLSTSRMPSSA